MPLIKILATEKTKEQKVKFMKEVTKLAVEVFGCPASAVSVIIDDSYGLDEWSVGGKTWEEIIEEN